MQQHWLVKICGWTCPPSFNLLAAGITFWLAEAGSVFTCASKPECLMSHYWRHAQDCQVSNGNRVRWSCCQVSLERLRNEITRLTAVKAFASIAQSPLSLDLSPVLEPLLAELTSFLRKANRVLRQASLLALEVTSFHSTGCLLCHLSCFW